MKHANELKEMAEAANRNIRLGEWTKEIQVAADKFIAEIEPRMEACAARGITGLDIVYPEELYTLRVLIEIEKQLGELGYAFGNSTDFEGNPIPRGRVISWSGRPFPTPVPTKGRME